MKKLVINVKRWLHGGKSLSVLRNESGSMCCLGFLARDCGANVSDILNQPSPEETSELNWPKGMLDNFNNNSFLAYDMMETNDSPISLAQKKSQLKKLFLEIGYRLTFK